MTKKSTQQKKDRDVSDVLRSLFLAYVAIFYDLAWSGKKAFNCLQQYPKGWAVFILKFQFLKNN
jgi:hypothetical protein